MSAGRRVRPRCVRESSRRAEACYFSCQKATRGDGRVSSQNEDRLERALETLLIPVVRVALKRGLAFGRFSELVKRATSPPPDAISPFPIGS